MKTEETGVISSALEKVLPSTYALMEFIGNNEAYSKYSLGSNLELKTSILNLMELRRREKGSPMTPNSEKMH